MLYVEFVPALIGVTSNGGPSCATGAVYQEAIVGCDQNTVHACGIVGGGAQVDLMFNPGSRHSDAMSYSSERRTGRILSGAGPVNHFQAIVD